MKVFVVVRNDLSRSQQAIQAGHAAMEIVVWGGLAKQEYEGCTLVYLKVQNEQELDKLLDQVNESDGIAYPFHEPDLNDSMTAFATHATEQVEKILENIPLL